MAIPESADIVRTAAEAEQRLKEEAQNEHERLVVKRDDPADPESLRRTAEQKVETTLGEMPEWVSGAIDVRKGRSAAEAQKDVPEEPKRTPAEERR